MRRGGEKKKRGENLFAPGEGRVWPRRWEKGGGRGKQFSSLFEKEKRRKGSYRVRRGRVREKRGEGEEWGTEGGGRPPIGGGIVSSKVT